MQKAATNNVIKCLIDQVFHNLGVPETIQFISKKFSKMIKIKNVFGKGP